MITNKNTKRASEIRSRLLEWSEKNPRDLPWKQNKDPYQIWISEIILQQTRVEQGRPYYERFVKRYPSVEELASTTEDELMKLWEGLGYYRRAKHMLYSARKIVQEYAGKFPEHYHEILELKGIGEYTAAAIASFAFDLPYVVVDGNVIRMISRLYAISEPVHDLQTRKLIGDLASRMLDIQNPAAFNQAIMDFGSLQCKPTNPDCANCPLKIYCKSFENDLVNKIPSKKTKKPKKNRYFYYIVPILGDYVYVRKREASDIWSGLFEFYLVETESPKQWDQVISDLDLPILKSISLPKKYRQTLSHQIINAEFLPVELNDDRAITIRDHYKRIKTKKIRNFAFPKVIDCFLRDKDVILNL